MDQHEFKLVRECIAK